MNVNGKNDVIQWLLEDENPAVKYRTQTELLGETADKALVVSWVNGFLPTDWQERTGLWYTYYLTALAECELTVEDIPMYVERAIEFEGRNFYTAAVIICVCGH